MFTSIITSVLFATSTAAASTLPAGVPTNAELAAAITAARSECPPFLISVSITRTSPSDPAYLQKWHDVINWDGASFRVDREYGHASGDGRVHLTRNVTAYGDGVAAVSRGESIRVAKSVASAAGSVGGGVMYQHYLRWYFLGSADGTIPAQDMVSVLQAPDTVIRPDLEELDGEACIVVERLDHTGSVYERIWVDPQHGYLPRRHEVVDHGTELSSWHLTSFIEVAPGCFLPSEGVHRLTDAGAADPNFPSVPTEETMTLAPIVASDMLMVDTNAPAPDVAGVLQVPSGVRIDDADTGQSWVASSQSIRDTARSALAAAGVRGFTEVPGGDSGPDGRALETAGIGAAALALGAATRSVTRRIARK